MNSKELKLERKWCSLREIEKVSKDARPICKNNDTQPQQIPNESVKKLTNKPNLNSNNKGKDERCFFTEFKSFSRKALRKRQPLKALESHTDSEADDKSKIQGLRFFLLILKKF